MQRKEPYANKRDSLAWMLARENILTRRANQRHISTIAPSADPPMARDRKAKIPISIADGDRTRRAGSL
jgi:hypothetical protein